MNNSLKIALAAALSTAMLAGCATTAGGGAYKIEAFRPGQEIIYVRYDDWKSGPLPRLRRIVQRDVPNAGNRRALLLKGDIDITFDLPPKDFSELAREGAAAGDPVWTAGFPVVTSRHVTAAETIFNLTQYEPAWVTSGSADFKGIKTNI